jgi:hypothetical protein
VLAVEAYEPRGWTALQIQHGNFSWNGSQWTGGCTGARVENVFIHHASETNTELGRRHQPLLPQQQRRRQRHPGRHHALGTFQSNFSSGQGRHAHPF